ncbi:hypothetical protein R3X25_05180 [Lutibacter sp. TH_r2]|uniref:hypothetical protein n=1 Tax=Lutibacter sp. TH_r2 TaxID=3082083 RepID=UPI0029543957|nr:hypothetical protein [Lutibacter sp. TH_r2]MDV7186666.1 hypothetical protein [Lutibacter sp. TH_r2]
MKNTIKFLTVLVAVFSFTFTSCDDDILDVDFNTTITAKIPVHVDQDQETVNESTILSLDNSDTNKYLNKIKGVEITKLTYKITNFSGDATGTINVDFKADNLILQTEGFVVENAYNNTTIFEVTDIDKLNNMANLLKNNKSVTVGVSGDCVAKENSMDFNVEVTAELKVTANPL